MLPKHARISSRAFSFVRQKSKVFHAPSMTLRVHYYKRIPEEGMQNGKRRSFAVVVSKKVASQSVLRSKLRRRGYAAIKSALPSLSDGFSAIVFFKKGIETYTTKDIEEELYDLFTQANIVA